MPTTCHIKLWMPMRNTWQLNISPAHSDGGRKDGVLTNNMISLKEVFTSVLLFSFSCYNFHFSIKNIITHHP